MSQIEITTKEGRFVFESDDIVNISMLGVSAPPAEFQRIFEREALLTTAEKTIRFNKDTTLEILGIFLEAKMTEEETGQDLEGIEPTYEIKDFQSRSDFDTPGHFKVYDPRTKCPCLFKISGTFRGQKEKLTGRFGHIKNKKYWVFVAESVRENGETLWLDAEGNYWHTPAQDKWPAVNAEIFDIFTM